VQNEAKIFRINHMKYMKLFSYLLFFISIFPSCLAINSTINTLGRSVSSIFTSPIKIPDKIIDPCRTDARLAVLWIGHASTLIQIDDKFILTDPVFTTTVGQFSKRLIEPGIDPENLPKIDVVLLSHMHIDHWSPVSLDLIESKVKEMIIPQGGFVYVPNYSFNTTELKTWQMWESDGLKITAVPVLHNGWRYGIDDAWMKTSFSGYIIEYNGICVYFSGDTGYIPDFFDQTREHFPEIDLALLPIAPIHPREYSQERHTDPGAAIKIMQEIGAKNLMPIHFDTFPESLDSVGEASATLQLEMEKNNLTSVQVHILNIGEQRVFIFREEKNVSF
jgi:L-ascorbate metabolism protein UlaG (beta-lactamase superfamily)